MHKSILIFLLLNCVCGYGQNCSISKILNELNGFKAISGKEFPLFLDKFHNDSILYFKNEIFYLISYKTISPFNENNGIRNLYYKIDDTKSIKLKYVQEKWGQNLYFYYVASLNDSKVDCIDSNLINHSFIKKQDWTVGAEGHKYYKEAKNYVESLKLSENYFNSQLERQNFSKRLDLKLKLVEKIEVFHKCGVDKNHACFKFINKSQNSEFKENGIVLLLIACPELYLDKLKENCVYKIQAHKYNGFSHLIFRNDYIKENSPILIHITGSDIQKM